MAYMLIFLLKKNVKLLTFFFSKNTCELDIVLTRTVNILTTNELVKLTMLWTTEPWFYKVVKWAEWVWILIKSFMKRFYYQNA